MILKKKLVAIFLFYANRASSSIAKCNPIGIASKVKKKFQKRCISGIHDRGRFNFSQLVIRKFSLTSNNTSSNIFCLASNKHCVNIDSTYELSAFVRDSEYVTSII